MKSHNKVDPTIKYLINSVFAFILFSIFLGSIIGVITNDVEIDVKCSSGFIGIEILNGDIENFSLNNIDNMYCNIKIKGNMFNIGKIIQ